MAALTAAEIAAGRVADGDPTGAAIQEAGAVETGETAQRSETAETALHKGLTGAAIQAAGVVETAETVQTAETAETAAASGMATKAGPGAGIAADPVA